MLLDEYLLDGVYPGDLTMAGTFGEIYDWMEGPLAEHFVCAMPPATLENTSDFGQKSMCWLPDGQFLSDNLIELRQVRVLPENTTVKYYTDISRSISLEGQPKIPLGGKYSLERNRDTRDWELQHTPSGRQLNFTFERPSYRACSQPGRPPLDVLPIQRYGWCERYPTSRRWCHRFRRGAPLPAPLPPPPHPKCRRYDSYHFGGFVKHSATQGSRADFRALARELREAMWMDRFTRAVTVSTMVLNPANGIGSLITVLIETPREGVMRITPNVLVMQRTAPRPERLHVHAPLTAAVLRSARMCSTRLTTLCMHVLHAPDHALHACAPRACHALHACAPRA